jgi:hypothetical protein
VFPLTVWCTNASWTDPKVGPLRVFSPDAQASRGMIVGATLGVAADPFARVVAGAAPRIPPAAAARLVAAPAERLAVADTATRSSRTSVAGRRRERSSTSVASPNQIGSLIAARRPSGA